MIKVKGTRNKKFQKRILILTGIVALLFTAWSLLNFNGMLKKTEKNKKYDNVTEWTEQNARLIEYKTARYYEILETAAARIKDMSLDSEETQRFLGRTYSKKETHFVYMRILNKGGKAPGMKKDYSEMSYFKTSMSGNKAISKNGTTYKSGVVLSVPIYNDAHQIEGILCGILSSIRLNIFDDIAKEKEKRNQFVLDEDGNYLLKQDVRNTTGTNFFEDMGKRDLSLLLPTIQFRIKSGVTVPFEIYGDNDDGMVAVIAPVRDIHLYTVTTIRETEIAHESAVYQKYVIKLTAKLIGMMVLVLLVYLYFQREDKRYIRRLNNRLMLNEETYRITARNSDTCVFTYDVETELIQFLNDKYKDIGLDQEQLSIPILLKNISKVSPQSCADIRNILETIENKEVTCQKKISIWSKGRMRYLQIFTTNIFDDSGAVSRMVGSIGDITDSETDPLTGAIVRAAGTERIEQILKSDPEAGSVHAFMIADLDNFKNLNDRLGHMWGDHALHDVVKIIRDNCRAQDVICRLGGDEFVVFFRDIPLDVLQERVKLLSEQLHITYENEGETVTISVSMGIALTEKGKVTFQELYKRADKGLYEVKRTKKGTWHIV